MPKGKALPENNVSSLEGLAFNIQTFGCQMNKHDSERVAGLLESCGMVESPDIENSDLVVFITCVVREGAETRLLGHVNTIKNLPLRKGSPLSHRVVAVGGCMGQRDGEKLLERAPIVNVVFGTNNIQELPELVVKSISRDGFESSVVEQSDDFSTDLPTVRESPYLAWLPIMTGCDNFCTYCIVPYVRGREKSRPMEEVVEEARGLVNAGVMEVALLGQNVNSYGRDIYGKPRFSEVLKRVSDTGIERIRFATSHPKDLGDDLIECFGSLSNLMPSLHLPVQSGSNRTLERMNRRYTRESYMELVYKLRETCPGIALSTDIIVGFPGETEQDFLDTLHLVEDVGYNQVFTFKYSPRTGTPAASYPDAVPSVSVSDRFERLFKSVEKGAFEANQFDMGKTEAVLVEGTSKKNGEMLTGRNPRNLNVHAKIPRGAKAEDFVGREIDMRITEARTWYLVGEVA